jgi:hypothetical protein
MTPMQQMFLGLGAAEKTYMENLFDIQLRSNGGTASNTTVTNNMKLSDGGLVWTKARSASHWHVLYDTARGSYSLTPNNANAEANNIAGATTFNSNGYTIASGYGENNAANTTYIDWVFKKQKGFVDIVTYTGNGADDRAISHGLGSVPGSIWVKPRSDSGTWMVYHRSLGNTKYLALNDTQAATTDEFWADTTPTSSQFYVQGSKTNANSTTYIAYIFAHNDAQFGDSGNQPAIACGTYTGNGSNTGPVVQVGFQPQFLIIKRAVGGTEHWMMFDEARGVYYYQYDQDIEIQASSDRYAINWLDFMGGYDDFQEGGFRITTSYDHINANNNTYVYWAIRRPDGLIGKPPDAGTDVFDCETRTGSDTGDANQKAASDIPGRVDMTITKRTDSGGEYWALSSRVAGSFVLKTESNTTMVTGATTDNPYDHQSGGAEYTANNGAANSGTVVDFTWKRHAGFDCLTYKGNGNEHHSIYHSLGKAPEMMWLKSVDTSSYDWHVYHKDMNGGSSPQDFSMHLNTVDGPDNNQAFNDFTPQANMFRVGLLNDTNANNVGFFAALFASVDGICKVGSYTGNGSNTGPSVTLGFVPRFLMIKKDGSGVSWNILSSATTFSSSDSKYMQFNSSAALDDTYDFAHTTADGFQLQSSNNEVNSNNANYLYYAHA